MTDVRLLYQFIISVSLACYGWGTHAPSDVPIAGLSQLHMHGTILAALYWRVFRTTSSSQQPSHPPGGVTYTPTQDSRQHLGNNKWAATMDGML